MNPWEIFPGVFLNRSIQENLSAADPFVYFISCRNLRNKH